jgi:hypothetical protein
LSDSRAIITDGYKNISKSKTPEENIKHFKAYVNNLKAFGFERRVYLWDETDIDSLLGKQEKTL